jgi:large repetitive protein
MSFFQAAGRKHARQVRAAAMRGPRRRRRPWAELLEDRALLAALTLQVTGASLTEPFNKAFTAAQVATFTSSNMTAKAADFTATIDWGDGTASSAGTIKADTQVKGRFDVTGDHTYKDGLTQETATVTIKAPKVGASATATTVVNVTGAPFTEVPVSLHAVEGHPTDETVVGKFDSHVGAVLATKVIITWDALSRDISPGKIVPDPTVKGRFDVIVVGTHKMLEETKSPDPFEKGPPFVEIQLSLHYSVTNRPLSADFSLDPAIDVADAPLKASGDPVTINTSVGADVLQTMGSFLDADPGGKANDYTVTINWGDQSPPTTLGGKHSPEGEVYGTADLFDVLSHHPYAKPGTFPLTITIRDKGDLPPLILKATAKVAPAQLSMYPASATEHIVAATFAGPFGTSFVGSLPDGNPGLDYAHYSATIDWGDKTQTPPDTKGSPFPSKDGKSILIIGGHYYEEEGSYTITLTVTNKLTGKATVASEQVTVKDAPLDAGVVIGPHVDKSGNFSGRIFGLLPDTHDDGTGWIVTINWGDGKSSRGTAKHIDGGIEISGSHAYAIATGPIWQGSVTVTDDGGMQVTVPVTFTTQ